MKDQIRSSGNTNTEKKNADNRNTDNRNTDNRNTDNRNTDNRNTDNRNTDNRNTDNRNADSRNTDNRNADSRNTDNRNPDSGKADAGAFEQNTGAGHSTESVRRPETEEQQLRKALASICEPVQATKELKERIDREIRERAYGSDASQSAAVGVAKGGKRSFRPRRIVIAVAAACLLVGTVCIAGTGERTLTGLGKLPVYTDYADMGKAMQRIGYTVDVTERFSNGFACDRFNIEDHMLLNENFEKMESVPALDVSYRRGEESIGFFAHKLLASDCEETMAGGRTPDQTLVCGDSITVNFYGTTYKSVPVDYELTEEDKANTQLANYEISVGSKQVEMNQSYSAVWDKDGVRYSLQGFDLSLSPDQMLQMAQELIEKE